MSDSSPKHVWVEDAIALEIRNHCTAQELQEALTVAVNRAVAAKATSHLNIQFRHEGEERLSIYLCYARDETEAETTKRRIKDAEEQARRDVSEHIEYERLRKKFEGK